MEFSLLDLRNKLILLSAHNLWCYNILSRKWEHTPSECVVLHLIAYWLGWSAAVMLLYENLFFLPAFGTFVPSAMDTQYKFNHWMLSKPDLCNLSLAILFTHSVRKKKTTSSGDIQYSAMPFQNTNVAYFLEFIPNGDIRDAPIMKQHHIAFLAGPHFIHPGEAAGIAPSQVTTFTTPPKLTDNILSNQMWQAICDHGNQSLKKRGGLEHSGRQKTNFFNAFITQFLSFLAPHVTIS